MTTIMVFLFSVPEALGDVVYLATGQTLKGLVVEEHHDRIVFSTYHGEIEIPGYCIDEIFFDNTEQNYAYLGDKALAKNNFELALGFYQKAYQINPDSEKVKDAFLSLIDAKNRQRIKLQAEGMLSILNKQLGLEIKRDKDKIKIVSVKKPSPARKAGIAAGDYITDVWGVSVMFMDTTLAAEIMAGAPSTPVKLTIERNIIVPTKKLAGRYFTISLSPAGLIINGLKTTGVITHINGLSTRYMPLSRAKKNIFNKYTKEALLTVKREIILRRMED